MRSTQQRNNVRPDGESRHYDGVNSLASRGHQSVSTPAPKSAARLMTNLLPDEVPASVRTVLTRIAVGDHVSSDAFARAFHGSVELPAPMRDVVLGSLMTAVMVRGPEADTVEALMRCALAVDAPHPPEVITGSSRPVLVLAGSGKKGMRTFNVSTPAALVAAAAGAKVIKVGSAATSSALGSRDLVQALGLPEQRSAAGVRTALASFGFAFVAVEPEIPVLDRLYGGRFHAPNPFSFGLAALVSPVRGDIVVFGLSHPRVDVAAEVLSRFGMDHVDVLTTCLPSGHYLDEIGATGMLRSCRVRDGRPGAVVTRPAEVLARTEPPFGLPTPHSSEEAVERTLELLAGDGLDSHRILVGLNAAHLLVLSRVAGSLGDAYDMTEEILRSGTAMPRVSVACHTNRDI